MRALSETLLAAQKQASGLPYISAVLSDYHGEATRIRLERHYMGSEAGYFGAVVVAPDGSLVRARIDPSTLVLYTQRVASPGPAADFSAWSSIATVSTTGGIALAANDSDVFLFYADTDNRTLRRRVSANNGATFGAASTVATASADVGHVAAAVSPANDLLLLWAEGATLYSSRFTGGAWGSRTAWSNTVASVSGIACRHWLDFAVIVCGEDAAGGDAKVWTAVYGDGVNEAPDTWSALYEVTTANAGSGFLFAAPALALVQQWRLFFVETYSGDAPYTRLHWSTMDAFAAFNSGLWRDPLPFDYDGEHGVAAAAGTDGVLWVSSPSGVWSGASPSLPALDVTDDVVEASVELDERGGSATVVLRNDAAAPGPAGRYALHGQGLLAVLRPGARLALGAGYLTTEGGETSTTAFWVESVEQTSSPAPRLIVNARDAWWLLERWRARRQFAWASGAKSVGQIIEYVCARAGLGLSVLSASDAVATLTPAFTIHPGENGATAVRRLLAMVPDVAFSQNGGLRMRLLDPEDGADYAYEAPGLGNPSQHIFTAARYRQLTPRANRVRALGESVYVEAFDFASIESAGEQTLQVIDLNLTDSAEAAARAAYELRRAAVRGRLDVVRLAGVNCGQELYDLVEVTDLAAALTAEKRRVLGLGWRYQSAPGGAISRYEMTLELGLP